METIAIVILAAGKGKRMKSAKLKVFHKAMGRTVIGHAYAASSLNNTKTICVIPETHLEQFQKALPPSVTFCFQKEQKGTADAVKSAMPSVEKTGAQTVLVLPGDMPLLRKVTIKKLLTQHKKQKNKITVLTSLAQNPKQYGRIVRDSKGALSAIVEDKDLAPEQRQINEINTGVYAFDLETLNHCLSKIRPENAQKEYYLTDAVKITCKEGRKVGGLNLGFSDECFGINSRADLAQAIRLLRIRKNEELLEAGVTIEDPDSTFIDSEVTIGQDTVIHPFTIITGHVVIGENCEIGPFAHLHEDVTLKDHACIGNFVDVKKSFIGEGSKAKHLAYLGNATLGKKVNIGAGTITANYDGVHKHPTYIGDGTRIGSNTVIVAPNRIGKNVITGAGSVVTSGKEIPSNSLLYGVPAKIAKTNLTVILKKHM